MHCELDNFSTRLLQTVIDLLPANLAPWGEAMLAEIKFIEGFWNRFFWTLGGVIALLTTRLRHSAQSLIYDENRRLDVTLIAAYHALFTLALFITVTWQLPRITEHWPQALPVLIMSYGACALPAVLALGLAIGDNSARVGAIMFSIIHILITWEYIRRGFSHHIWFSNLRIVLDVAIIFALNRRSVREVFRTSPLELHLGS